MTLVSKSFTVKASRGRTFRVWTERVGAWWPPGHRLSGDPSASMKLEAVPGGRFFETTADGREFHYGKVLEVSPGERLVCDFYLGTGADQPTRLDVRFLDVPDGTLVEIEHAAGAAGDDLFGRVAVRFARNWPVAIESFTHHLHASRS